MQQSTLEHVNITVRDISSTAQMLSDIFGWHVRWQGDAKDGGKSIHVGSHDSYIAIYAPPCETHAPANSYETRGGLNHVGVVVEDLDAVEIKVRDAGFEPFSHADYEPGRRFYFRDDNNIEFEVVSY